MSYRADHDLTGTIDSLYIYPIKSCAGIAVQEARITSTGLQWDRAFLVTDPGGDFITQREQTRMALIQPTLVDDDVMLLDAPGMPQLRVPLAVVGAGQASKSVRVWNDVCQAFDTGEEAAEWLSSFLQIPCRLMRFDPEHRRIVDRKWTGAVEATTQFADGYPMLVTSTASMDEFNQRLTDIGAEKVDVRRFRPNIVLAGVEGHDEDRIESLFIEVAPDAHEEIEIVMTKPCSRCPIPDIDPDTAIAGTSVNSALRSYRQDPRVGGALTFGMNAITLQGEGLTLRVGQRMAANMRFE